MESENTLHVSHSSINSLLSDTTYNDVVQTEMIASFSINSKSQNQKCDKHSKCHSNTVLENSKTLTKKAAIEAVSAIIPHESDDHKASCDKEEAPIKVGPSNGEGWYYNGQNLLKNNTKYLATKLYLLLSSFQRARRACVQQFQGINIYKEEESETTCTLESDDETSEDNDEDADESSIQEDVDNDKSKNKERDTPTKINSNQQSSQTESKGENNIHSNEVF